MALVEREPRPGLDHEPTLNLSELHRVSLTAYLDLLREMPYQETKRARKDYESAVQEILSSSPERWRIEAEYDRDKEIFFQTFHFDLESATIANVDYEKYEESTVVYLKREDVDRTIAVPIDHIPQRFNLVTDDEY